MGDLLVGVEDRLLVARMGRAREADGHALGEERAVVGTRQEVPPAASHDPVPLGHRRQDVLQRAAAGPPELVGVRVDHPVGVVLGGGDPSHPRDPLVLAHVVARLAEEPQDACTLVPLEDLGRPVARRVVGRDHLVDARVKVVGHLRVHDVRLVAGEQCHHDLHEREPASTALAASTTRSAACPSTTPTTCSTAPAALRGELVRMRQGALDAGDDVLEALGSVERPGRRELLVVLPDDVLRRPRLTGRRALVVEHAHGRPVAHERVEEDRARVADDDVGVLEEGRELLEVGVAGRLDDDTLPTVRRGEALPPLGVSRVRPEQQLEALASAPLLPPRDDPLDEAPLVGRVARRVPGDEHERSAEDRARTRAGVPRSPRAAGDERRDRSGATP